MPRVTMVVNSDFRYDSRVQKEALALSQAGHDVTVLSLAMTVPNDQSFPGIRVLNPTTEKMAWFPYKPSYLKACRQVLCALLRENGDIWHGHDLDTLPFAYLAAKLKGGKLVYDSHELWPGYDWPGGGRRLKFARRVLWKGWLRLERMLARQCHLVIAVNESCALEMARSLGIKAPLVLRNCVDPVAERDTVGAGLRERLGLVRGETLAVYTGQFQTGRGLENLITAWAGLDNGAHLALVGKGPLEEKLRRMVLLAELKNVHFLPPVKAWELPGFICGATLGVVLIEDVDPCRRFSLPNKLLEYIAAGIPALASDLPEIRRLVEKYPVAVFADPREPHSIRTVLETFLLNGAGLAERKKSALEARENLSWQREVRGLVAAYSKLCDRF